MKLIHVVDFIKELDNQLIIFLEDMADHNSEAVILEGAENDQGIKQVNGKKYYYLLEVFLAKEVIEDYINYLGYRPGDDQLAKRIYEYGINDA